MSVPAFFTIKEEPTRAEILEEVRKAYCPTEQRIRTWHARGNARPLLVLDGQIPEHVFAAIERLADQHPEFLGLPVPVKAD